MSKPKETIEDLRRRAYLALGLMNQYLRNDDEIKEVKAALANVSGTAAERPMLRAAYAEVLSRCKESMSHDAFVALKISLGEEIDPDKSRIAKIIDRGKIITKADFKLVHDEVLYLVQNTETPLSPQQEQQVAQLNLMLARYEQTRK
jgi:hypothetical protein